MHYRDIACTRSFDKSVTTAESQKIECFKSTANTIFINLVIVFSSLVVKLLQYFIYTMNSMLARESR
jgi:hypothetical protein